jgi:hypothetical protein
MRGVRPFGGAEIEVRMLRLLYLTIIGLSVAGGPSVSAQDKLERILSSFGYVIKESNPTPPTAWEKAQFQTAAKRVLKIRSAKAVPRRPNTFYRFTVIEERYADAGSAEMRLSRLRERPPDLSPEDGKAFPLRTGFRYGQSVYIIGTDVSMFEGEMSRIAKGLAAAFRRRRD